MKLKLFCMRVGVAESAFPVDIEDDTTVGDLKEAIKLKCQITTAPQQLSLFVAKRGDDWLSGESDEVVSLAQGDSNKVRDLIKTPLPPMRKLSKIFANVPDEEVLHVLVLDPEAYTKLSTPTSPHMVHPDRRKRWLALNERLDRNKKAKLNGNGDGTTTGYSNMRWSEVEDLLQYSRYTQKRKEVPAERLAFLFEYLTLVTKMLGECNVKKKEAKCYHFIAPVLICICDLLGDGVNILIEETVNGNEVHGNGFFEFVVQRGNKKFCIVEAKKEDFFQGATQALIGCEAVADREGLDMVYAIVTDFVRWDFFRSGNSKIEQYNFSIEVDDGVPKFESIKVVCELLYGFLFEE